MNPFYGLCSYVSSFCLPHEKHNLEIEKKKSVLVDLITYEEWLKLISWNTVDVEI